MGINGGMDQHICGPYESSEAYRGQPLWIKLDTQCSINWITSPTTGTLEGTVIDHPGSTFRKASMMDLL